VALKCLALAGLLLLSVPSLGAETASKQSLSFEGRDRTYYLYVPPVATQAPPPLIVLLHGSGGSGLAMIQRWQDEAAREGIVLLAPESLHTDIGWDIHNDGPEYIHAAIQAVAASHAIDFHRLYVFGQSGGAVYALNLAMLESEYFAAAAYHAGGWRKPAEYHFADYARRKIPVAAYVGDKDEYFSVASVQATENLLKQRGIPAELHLLPGRVHAYSDVPADFHDTVWNFLKANALIDIPKYAPYRFGAAPIR
jgi:poly(3-hydroxybutyrate) depolymerase